MCSNYSDSEDVMDYLFNEWGKVKVINKWKNSSGYAVYELEFYNGISYYGIFNSDEIRTVMSFKKWMQLKGLKEIEMDFNEKFPECCI
ncbi:hypothetical protein [Leptospira jelokensis]|uniref:hypothetical protein n=1 Tax=Leptospira jelokensis TaxID=2484931 RepID=UPI001090AFF2|nr:hypothetical protein [Leptospira jelokensis]TGL97953.1 hypothetical protein EHQ79_19085 [Leptospira jelokensis]